MNSNTINRFLIFAIILFSLFLRVYPIKFGVPSKNLALTSYHPDEAISFYALEKMKPGKLNFHPTDGFFWGSLHLYSLGAVLQAAKMLGFLKTGDRQFFTDNLNEADKLYIIGRLLTVLFGVLSVLLLYYIGRSAFNERTGVLAAFIMAVTPVHVINSFFVRVDIQMLFFCLLTVLFSLRIIKTGEFKYYLLSGLFAGLASATKYNGGLFIICPLAAHYLRENREGHRGLTYMTLAALGGFIIGCPYSVIDFPAFFRYFKGNFIMAKGSVSTAIFGPGWISYITVFLRYGLGLPLVLAGLLGIACSFRNILKWDSNYMRRAELFLLVTGLIVYLVTSLPRHQRVWYTLPAIPFFVIFSARFLDIIFPEFTAGRKRIFLNFAKALFTVSVLVYTALYSFAYVKLYADKNVREEASEWIERNIPAKASVGIAKSYFWTPPVLRQYNPPYRVLAGGGIPESLENSVLGLKEVSRQADYMVLSEYEWRNFLHKKMGSYYPEQKKILDDIMNNEYREIKRFTKKPEFLGMVFGGMFPPWDWIMANPEIIVLKKVRRETKITGHL